MGKIDKDTFGYLGLDYQFRLIAQFLTDKKFAQSIMDIVNPNYFEDEHLRVIVKEIKDTYETDEVIPDIGSLQFRLMESITNEYTKEFIVTQLRKVKEANLNDTTGVQKIALNFCKQQELKKTLDEAQGILKKGKLEDVIVIEEKLRKVLEIGSAKDDAISVFHDIENVLADDFRQPIATGINGLDEIMDGGLSRTELAVILAPFGVGKTTMITKIANSAFEQDLRVLQIFFEDNPKVIQRKHLACWTGHNLNDLNNHKEELVKLAKDKDQRGGELLLKKMRSDGTTIPMIRQYIRKLVAQGKKPDVMLIDYIDCIQPSRRVDDVNVGEGQVMREFETLLAEFEIAGWTAVQGNRSSIGAEVVDSTMIGGSIKKGQIGHFIVSIAKSLDQKENGTATMTVLKSRFGKDGVIFEDIIFNNGTLQIDMSNSNKGRSFTEQKVVKQERDQARVNFVLESLGSLKPDEE